MTRSKTPAPPTEAQLRASLATLRQACEANRPCLRRLLAAGQDTAPIRAENVALERRIEDITAALADLAAERERAAAANAASQADALATDALSRIKATLAGLQPPPHPTIQELEP
jgi:hypothetical protein